MVEEELESINKPLDLVAEDYRGNNPEDYEETKLLIEEEFQQDSSNYVITEELHDIVQEIKQDPEYIRLKNTPIELIDSTRDLNIKLYQQVREFNKDNPVKPELILTKELREKEIIRCKYDIVYFAENYVEVATVGGYIPYMINDDLRMFLRLNEASVITLFMSSRQSSKTYTAMVASSWYFNFWARSQMTLINIQVADNKKNLRTVIDILDRTPVWMNSMSDKALSGIDESKVSNNVFEKINPLGSKINGGVVDRQDPEASLRGRTSSLSIDEGAWCKGIDIAYYALSFIYNTYGNLASRTVTPAPFSLTSTPADIVSPSGKFWFEMWEAASDVKYDIIKDLMPYEIKAYLRTRRITSVRINQFWYKFEGRATEHTMKEIFSKEFYLKYHDILMNPSSNIEQIYTIDEGLGEWLDTTKSIVKTEAKLKMEVYSLFLTANTSSIFDETEADALSDNILSPKEIIDIDIEYLDKQYSFQLNILKTLDLNEASFYRYFVAFDVAGGGMRTSGDKFSGIIMDRFDNMSVVGSLHARLPKVKLAHRIIKKIVEAFNGRLNFTVERNSMGISVVEDCLEDNYLKSRMLYKNFVPNEKYGKKVKDMEKREYGFWTSVANRDILIGLLIDYAVDTPEKVVDRELVSQLLTLVEKNGKVQSAIKFHDDAVMSLGIGLYCVLYEKDYITKISRSLLSKTTSNFIISEVLNKNTTTPKQLQAEMDSDIFDQYEDEFKELKDQNKSLNMFNQLASLNFDD